MELEEISVAVQKLGQLLSDPHPGLSTWQSAMREQMLVLTPTTMFGVAEKLRTYGNGVCLAHWNDSFDVELLGGGLVGGDRRILGSGRTPEEAFEGADRRIKELNEQADHCLSGERFPWKAVLGFNPRR